MLEQLWEHFIEVLISGTVSDFGEKLNIAFHHKASRD